jgi:hypothetical protein
MKSGCDWVSSKGDGEHPIDFDESDVDGDHRGLEGVL